MDSIFTKEMSSFISGYMRCALWSSVDNNEDPMDSNYDVDDISAETQAAIVGDCEKFYRENKDIIPTGYSMNSAGHDFWLTRNGHGAGFWDRDLGEVGDILTEKCKDYPEVDLYIGDDGLIYA